MCAYTCILIYIYIIRSFYLIPVFLSSPPHLFMLYINTQARAVYLYFIGRLEGKEEAEAATTAANSIVSSASTGRINFINKKHKHILRIAWATQPVMFSKGGKTTYGTFRLGRSTLLHLSANGTIDVSDRRLRRFSSFFLTSYSCFST